MPELNMINEDKQLLLDYVKNCNDYFKDQYVTVLSIVNANSNRQKMNNYLSELANQGATFTDSDTLIESYKKTCTVPFLTELRDGWNIPLSNDIKSFENQLFIDYEIIIKRIVGNFFYNKYSHHLSMKLVDYLDTNKIYYDHNMILQNLQSWWDEFICTTDKPNYDLPTYANYINRIFDKKYKKDYLDDTSMALQKFIGTSQFKGMQTSGKTSIKFPKFDIWWMSDYPLFDRINALLSWMERTYKVTVKNNQYKLDPLKIGKNIYNNSILTSITIYKNNSVLIKFKNQSIMELWNNRINKLKK
ncbi:hypothetical protein DY052_08410 [Apilactobacillus timberlakei]|uniref:hypothetical protein n=1 Tax=Apilactobacillus timberlakei TaxID=2008380 RepID=UPI001129521C|nr:hypothetical protein [Apilactobacillus timberlakei]TPR13012.1 hypothetical protein DY052_08410 [Apilactobacillus timberlakei]